MIKVSIIDSCQIYARGLADVLTSEGFRVVGSQPTAPEPLLWWADIFLVDPDAVRDVTLGVFVADAVRAAPVLLIGFSTEPDLIVHYMDTGAAGFVDRRTNVSGMVAAVRSVADGGTFWTTNLPATDEQPSPADGVALSPRERQVLRQIARGLTHGQVARRLGISPHTVDTYVKRIRSKLDLGNKAELTRAAVLGSYDMERDA